MKIKSQLSNDAPTHAVAEIDSGDTTKHKALIKASSGATENLNEVK